MTGVHIKKGKSGQRYMGTRPREDEETGVMRRQGTPDFHKQLEAGREAWNRSFLEPTERASPSRPSSQASGLQDCERINFCGSKQSWLRYLVTAAPGNEHSSLRLPGSRPFQNLGNSFQPLCIQIHQEVKNKPQ